MRKRAPCAAPIACTIDSPKPRPSSWPDRVLAWVGPPRWNGVSKRGVSVTRTSGPVLATLRAARPDSESTVTHTMPSAWL